MAMPAGGGRKKIDLADLGTVQVLDLLSPMDEIGVFAVDTTPHEIVPLDSVEHNAAYRGKILAIDSMGGGIYVYEALVASARMISGAQAQTKHIILFADASDSEQSDHYEEIVDKLREAGITVSVVGLGTDHDCDANLLKDIARRGGGECYFSDNPDEIPAGHLHHRPQHVRGPADAVCVHRRLFNPRHGTGVRAAAARRL
jgi:hypothetical protein